MNLFSQLFPKSSIRGFKLLKMDDHWVVMYDYSIVYAGSKERCKAYMASLPVAV